MADDASPAEEPVTVTSTEKPEEGSPAASDASAEVRQKEAVEEVKVDQQDMLKEVSAAKEEQAPEESKAPPADQAQEKGPVTETAVADAIAAATPRGEKTSEPEAKVEEPAPKEPEPVAETKKVIKEEKTAPPPEELAPVLERKLSLKVDRAASQPSSPSAGDNILPTSPQIRAITGNDSALPVKEYLNSTIVPVLRDALRALVKTRPDDPYEFVAKYLAEHKPSK